MNRGILQSVILFVLLLSNLCFASKLTMSPIDVVNKRMDAHNSHDLEAFLSTYSNEFQVYDYPNTPLGKPGRAHISRIFGPMFKSKSVSVVVHHQIQNGNYVVNHETVTSQGTEKDYISIYEVKNGLIQSVRFIKE